MSLGNVNLPAASTESVITMRKVHRCVFAMLVMLGDHAKRLWIVGLTCVVVVANANMDNAFATQDSRVHNAVKKLPA